MESGPDGDSVYSSDENERRKDLLCFLASFLTPIYARYAIREPPPMIAAYECYKSEL